MTTSSSTGSTPTSPNPERQRRKRKAAANSGGGASPSGSGGSAFTTRTFRAFVQSTTFLTYGISRDVLSVPVGLALAFYGGRYMRLVVAVQAVQACGWEKLRDNLLLVVKHADPSLAAALAPLPAPPGTGGGGGGDVTETAEGSGGDHQVTNEQVAEAVQVVYSGCLAVVASVRSQMARAVVMGASVGDQLHQCTKPLVVPLLQRYTPDNLHPFLSLIAANLWKAAGIIGACMVQRVVDAAHCAFRGGRLVATASQRLAGRMGVQTPEALAVCEIFGWGVTAWGLWWQLQRTTVTVNWMEAFSVPAKNLDRMLGDFLQR